MASDSETTIVSETGLGKYQVEARVGDAAFLIDEPVAFGGLGTGQVLASTSSSARASWASGPLPSTSPTRRTVTIRETA